MISGAERDRTVDLLNAITGASLMFRYLVPPFRSVESRLPTAILANVRNDSTFVGRVEVSV
jgi:hypothetical protein